MYHAAAGNLSVPKDHVTEAGFPLGRWVSNKRSALRAGRLAPERVAELAELGIR